MRGAGSRWTGASEPRGPGPGTAAPGPARP